METSPHETQDGVVVVGEALIDIVTTADGQTVAHPGGSAANTAVALARLGRRTDLLTSFADDEHGRMIALHLDRAGVRVATDPRVVPKTSVARATVGADGSARYSFDIDWHLKVPDRIAPAVLHLCSLATVLMPGATPALEIVHRLRPSTTITYDVNARPAITGVSSAVVGRVELSVAASDLVKASDEDLATLFPGSSLASAARRLLALGPAVVVVTRGGDGVAWFSRGREVEMSACRATVVDTIGAGDTFSAALIDTLWTRGHLGSGRPSDVDELGTGEIREVLAYASRAAAVTVSRPGADPPSRRELAALRSM